MHRLLLKHLLGLLLFLPFFAIAQSPLSELDSLQREVRLAKNDSSQLGNSLILTVRDNGNGIPGNIIQKIFQPFFTTKPTGEGTGLGLSLSYDIVKAHGGELKVETKEGEGTVFMIQLPPNSTI